MIIIIVTGKGEKLMAAIDDLTAAVNNLATVGGEVVTAINNLKAGGGGTPDSALTPLTEKVNQVVSTLQAAIQ